MSAKLPIPVHQVLAESVDEAALERTWRAIGERRSRPPVKRGWVAVGAVAVGAAAIALAWFVQPSPKRGAVSVTVDGEDLAQRLASHDPARPAVFRLSDRSRIALSAGARVETVANTAERVRLVVRTGTARFEIAEQSGREWIIDGGGVLIVTRAAEFAVDRSETRVRVEVFDRELVVGDRVVQAGETWETVTAPGGATAVTKTEAETATETEAEAAIETKSAIGMAMKSKSGARRRVTSAAVLAAHLDAGSGSQSQPTVDDLLALADAARADGRPRDAMASLRRIVEEHADHPDASVAGFTLGRVLLHELDDAAAAADAFERAIALGLPSSLIEAALAGAVEAHARAGDAAAAARRADEYRRRFPDGRHRARVDRWSPAR
jgi:hypothetical protein